MVATTVPLLANVGTPLMWAGMFHLVYGNAIIGICEGLLIARIFRVGRIRAVICMCGANYLSMAIAVFGLEWRGVPWGRQFLQDVTIENVGSVLLAALAACIVASAIFEWPFCYLSLRGHKHRFSNSFGATLVAQGASYAVLVPMYLLVSPVSVVTHVDVVHPATIRHEVSADVYYVNPDDGDVYRTDLEGADPHFVAKMGGRELHARLYLVASSDRDTFDLGVCWGPEPDDRRVIVANVLPASASIGDAVDVEHCARMGFGRAVDLQPSSAPLWKVRTGFWSAEGLKATNEVTSQSYQIALETPFLAWSSRNASVLPGSMVIYQLGKQVVLLDLAERRMALLARGRGPLVVLHPTTDADASGTSQKSR